MKRIGVSAVAGMALALAACSDGLPTSATDGRIAPQAAVASPAAAPGKITFVFDYSDNDPGVGFLDPVYGPARRAAVDKAAALYSTLFGSHFSNSATLNIKLLSSVNPDDGVAYASSEVVPTPGTFGNGEVIRTKLTTGVDLNGALSDGTIFFDFQPDLHWELDPNASVDDGEVSFYNAMLHEFTHAIGFASLTLNLTSDIFGAGAQGSGTRGTWAKWDQFINDGTTDIVNHTTFELNQAALNNTEPFGGYFYGPRGVAANSGPVHLSTQRSHLDDNLFPTALMKSGGVDVGIPGVVNTRVWNSVEVGILTDLGYTPNAAPVPYTFRGFLFPLVNVPATNLVPASLPMLVRFDLGGDRGSNILASPITSGRISCTGTGAETDVKAATAVPGTKLEYVPLTKVYRYIWDTDRRWAGTCRMFHMRLTDGSDRVLRFKFF